MTRLIKPVTRIATIGRDEVAVKMLPSGHIEFRVLRCRKAYLISMQHVFDRAVKIAATNKQNKGESYV